MVVVVVVMIMTSNKAVLWYKCVKTLSSKRKNTQGGGRMESTPEVSVDLEKFLQVNWPNGGVQAPNPSSPLTPGLKGLNVAIALFTLRQTGGLRKRPEGGGGHISSSPVAVMRATEPTDWTLPAFDQTLHYASTKTVMPQQPIVSVFAEPVSPAATTSVPTITVRPKVSAVTQVRVTPSPNIPTTKVVATTLYQKQQQRLQQQRQQQAQRQPQQHNINGTSGTAEYGEFNLLPPGPLTTVQKL